NVDTGFNQEALEAEVDQRRGPDVQAFDRADVALPGLEVGAQHQEPVGVLGEGGEELAALPARERERHAVGGAADEIDAAVAQHLQGFVDRKDQLERHVEAFRLEESELDRGGGGEIGIGDQIGNRNLHQLVLL